MSARTKLVALAATVTAAIAVLGEPASAGVISSTLGPVQLQNADTGACLTGGPIRYNNTAAVYMAPCNGSRYQRWYVQPTGTIENAATYMCISSIPGQFPIQSTLCMMGTRDWIADLSGNTLELTNRRNNERLDAADEWVFTRPVDDNWLQAWYVS
ncbi:RICIN domain-containing protein [Dactylosporangium sp. NPDC051541]|uniref:RICIN domain-containing protein n=1 Tax=Dactylosporangium sp. NPDC051541 TaxID=3363977 RepID=UPI00378BEB93